MAGGNITEIAGGSMTTTVNNDYDVYSDTLHLNSGTRVSLHGEESGVTFGNKPKDPPAGKATVNKAYFARKVEKKALSKQENYTVVKGDTQASIAKAKLVEKAGVPKNPVPGKVIVLKYYEKKFTLERTASGIIGSKVYLVAETGNLEGEIITFQVLGSNNTTFVKPDEAAGLVSDGSEKSEFIAKVGEFTSKNEFDNPGSFFKNKAVVEIELKPKEDTTKADWSKKINDSKEKCAYVHLTVKAESDKEVQYSSEDPAVKTPSTDKGIYLTKADLWFTIKTCFCNRALLKDDLILMGISAAKAADFLAGINEAIKNYEINSCMRIAHFVAQIKHESINFTATQEGWGPTTTQLGYEGRADLGNTEKGDGEKFMGRGLIQITGRGNYTSYGTYKSQNFTTGENNLRMAESPYSVDSAGWYWKEHLSNTNLNDSADLDDLIYVTYRINGGFNGYRDREKNLKNILNSIGSCANTELSEKGTYKLSTSKCNNGKDGVWKFANLQYDENDLNSGDETSSVAYTRYITLANADLTALKAKKTLTKAQISTKATLESRIATATERSN